MATRGLRHRADSCPESEPHPRWARGMGSFSSVPSASLSGVMPVHDGSPERGGEAWQHFTLTTRWRVIQAGTGPERYVVRPVPGLPRGSIRPTWVPRYGGRTAHFTTSGLFRLPRFENEPARPARAYTVSLPGPPRHASSARTASAPAPEMIAPYKERLRLERVDECMFSRRHSRPLIMRFARKIGAGVPSIVSRQPG